MSLSYYGTNACLGRACLSYICFHKTILITIKYILFWSLIRDNKSTYNYYSCLPITKKYKGNQKRFELKVDGNNQKLGKNK